MKRKQLINSSIILIFGSLTSCQTVKIIDGNGYGGNGNTPFKLNQSSNNYPKTENQIAKKETSVDPIVHASLTLHNKNNEVDIKYSQKYLKRTSNLSSELVTIVNNHKKLDNIRQVNKNSSFKTQKKGGSKFGMWILLILGFPIAALGFILTMLGMFNSLLGSEPLAYFGLVMFALGGFFIWRAYKIRKKLKNGE